jgi:hypothetical protein
MLVKTVRAIHPAYDDQTLPVHAAGLPVGGFKCLLGAECWHHRAAAAIDTTLPAQLSTIALTTAGRATAGPSPLLQAARSANCGKQTAPVPRNARQGLALTLHEAAERMSRLGHGMRATS